MKTTDQLEKTDNKSIFAFMIGWRFGYNSAAKYGVAFGIISTLFSFILCEDILNNKHKAIAVILLFNMFVFWFAIKFLNKMLIAKEYSFYEEHKEEIKKD